MANSSRRGRVVDQPVDQPYFFRSSLRREAFYRGLAWLSNDGPPDCKGDGGEDGGEGN